MSAKARVWVPCSQRLLAAASAHGVVMAHAVAGRADVVRCWAGATALVSVAVVLFFATVTAFAVVVACQFGGRVAAALV